MSRVRFVDVGLEAEVQEGTTVLEAARTSGAPEGDRCGGVCACSTCHVYVTRGAELLSEAEDEELDVLEKALLPNATSRLGCQARVEGDGVIEVRIADESFAAFVDEHPDQREPAEALWAARKRE